MKICVSGLTGSGKSTLSRRLAEHYGIPLLSGGDMLKRLIAGEEALADPG
ncbi:MAG: adenylate kinase, partial [Thermoproteota archaeon]